MAQERYEVGPLARQIEMPHTTDEVKALPLQLPAATAEQAKALDQVFAAQPVDRNSAVDAISLAAAGMLWHDIIKDTLAPATEQGEDEPAEKAPEPDGEPEPD